MEETSTKTHTVEESDDLVDWVERGQGRPPESTGDVDDSLKRLIHEFSIYDESSLVDHLSMLAVELEDFMRQCGGVPGQDYTRRDIFEWTMKVYIAKTFKAGD